MRFMQVEEAAELMKLEYAETPDLALTLWQAQRLWNLSEDLCVSALRSLERSSYLVQAADGTYVRRNIGQRITTTQRVPARLPESQ